MMMFEKKVVFSENQTLALVKALKESGKTFVKWYKTNGRYYVEWVK